MEAVAPEQLAGSYAYRETKLLGFCLTDEAFIEKSSTKLNDSTTESCSNKQGQAFEALPLF